MKRCVVIFGTEQYTGTIELLLRSIENMVDGVYVYAPDNIDNSFYEKNKTILNNTRGAGYWLWKPYVISKTLDILNDDDICFYLDAGVIATGNINVLFDICNDSEILLFENRCGNSSGDIWKNNMWTKQDCFNLMNCKSNDYILGNQVEASFQLYKKNSKSVSFVNEYLNFCQNEYILTDLPSITGPELPEFREHRHDQSILSLLAIKYNIKTEHPPTQWGEHLDNGTRKYKTLFYQHKQKLHLRDAIPIQLPNLYSKFKIL